MSFYFYDNSLYFHDFYDIQDLLETVAGGIVAHDKKAILGAGLSIYDTLQVSVCVCVFIYIYICVPTTLREGMHVSDLILKRLKEAIL